MSGLVVAVLLAAAPAGQVKLASPGLNGFKVSAEMTQFCGEQFAQELSLQGVRVVTSSEIAALIGFERQKQLLGCADESTNCMVELANALGVDGIITGSIGKFGKSIQLNLKILASGDGRPVFVHSGRVQGEEAVLDELSRAAKLAAPELKKAFQRTAPAPPKEEAPNVAVAAPAPSVSAAPPRPYRRWAWIPGVAGGLLAAGGGYFLLQAKAHSDALTGGDGPGGRPSSLTLDGPQAEAYAADGARQQTIGLALAGAGAVAAGVAVGLFLWPAQGGSVAVAASPGGVSVVGAF